MLLASCGGIAGYCWSSLNRPCKRSLFFCLSLVLLLTFIGIYRFELNELPDRWHGHGPFQNPEPLSRFKTPFEVFDLDPDAASRHSPIIDLIMQSDLSYRHLLNKETAGVAQAAQAYRQKRGRHPPPHFRQWVEFAESHGCVMIEEFFDRIYHDLEPFWAIPPEKIRAAADSSVHFVRIENGNASRSEAEALWMPMYFDMIQKLETYLPDLLIPINMMDESRVLVPWETVNEHMKAADSSRNKQDLRRAPRNQAFTDLTQYAVTPEEVVYSSDRPFWNMARKGCPPDSEARTLDLDKDFSTPPSFPSAYPYGSHAGFVQNYTISQDFCHHAHIRNLHGTFVEPLSVSTTASLVPIFSGSKLLSNNDILIPAAMYWTTNERFSETKEHVQWEDKMNEAFWRGTGSGGRNKAENWTRFQRHRMISMMNGTQVEWTVRDDGTKGTYQYVNNTDGLPYNFPLPNQSLYPLVSAKVGRLVDWIRSFSDIAFAYLECYPATNDGSCSYTGHWYRHARSVPMHRMYLRKYLPDMDGNSFSGRFRAFLMSNSLPIKATLYTEWHDSRLIPWKHFVPMDNTFVDVWSIFEFLFQHDHSAKTIAIDGREWAERVLRKEDMLVYVYRLLLEYARIVDPYRDELGYGEDLPQ